MTFFFKFFFPFKKTAKFQALFVLMIFILLSSCKKRNPNPELSDLIYQKIGQEIQIKDGEIKAKETELEGIKKDASAAKLQTGANKVYEVKILKATDQLTKLKQQLRSLEIKKEERKLSVQKMYLESLAKNSKTYLEKEEQEKASEKLEILVDSFKEKDTVPRGTKKEEKPKEAKH